MKFAQPMIPLGSQLTVVDRDDRVLKSEDEDVSRQLRDILEKEGVQFLTSASC